jgi:hypothetical protein
MSKLAACACALLFLTAAAGRAAAQGAAPSGSYRQTCQVSSYAFNHMLVARCKNKGGAWVSTRLRFAFLCEGDIWNNDGQLGCNKSAASARFKSAVSAFNSAAPVVLGRAPKSTDIAESANSESEILAWLAVMHAGGMGATYHDGMKFSDAVAVLKLHASQQPLTRDEIIRNALNEVHGSVDQSKLDVWRPQVQARKAWFATIVSAERQGKKKD